MKPLAIDLYCGLGGWAEGFLAEGYDVIGFDIERHDYGTGGYPGQLVLQDVTTLHGSQFKNATVIVASPPCQAYSYRAMPWKRAKALPPPDNTLFETCFRIQREANKATCHCECWRCKARGHCVRCDGSVNTGKYARYIPLIVENVRGAQKWVGRSAWNFGSYHLWGDVPALMPIPHRAHKNPGFRFDGSGKSFQSESVKNAGTTWRLNGCNAENRMVPTKVAGLDWSGYGKPGYKAKGFNVTAAQRHREDVKCGGGWFGKGNDCSLMRQHNSRSDSRKAASAMIAKIPFPLARHIAEVMKQMPQHPASTGGKPL